MSSATGLLDTSILISRHNEGQLELPDEVWISVLSVAELRTGVLVAKTERIRSQRLEILSAVQKEFQPLPVDDAVADQFALIRAESMRRRHKPKIVDALIAATAIANDLPLYTTDRDFRTISGLTLQLIK